MGFGSLRTVAESDTVSVTVTTFVFHKRCWLAAAVLHVLNLTLNCVNEVR